MKKFTFYFDVVEAYEVTIEAENEEEAYDLFYDEPMDGASGPFHYEHRIVEVIEKDPDCIDVKDLR